jgi:hypothetical protein
MNGHRQTGPTGPFRAKSGNGQCTSLTAFGGFLMASHFRSEHLRSKLMREGCLVSAFSEILSRFLVLRHA